MAPSSQESARDDSDSQGPNGWIAYIIRHPFWRPMSEALESLDVSIAARSEQEQAEVMREDTGFRWTRLWPVPLYGVAFLAHKGVRRRFPMSSPPMTPFKLPELYGIMALGHAAYLEGDRLSKKTFQDPLLRDIEQFSEGAKTIYSDWRPKKIVETKKRLARCPISSLLPYQSLDCGTHRATTWALSRLWSDRLSLVASSAMLVPHCEAAGVSTHDTKLLVEFFSQRMATPHFYKLSFLLREDLTPTLSFWAATILLIETASSGWGRGTRMLVNGVQRAVFYSMAYRVLAGYYRHYASIWGLEDFPRAATAMSKALEAVRGERLEVEVVI
ncbi:hypothetical protein C8T65DRAFT_642120 [Cerioporus squamosus]|nr:hypothetical protein C8T65DRAFT_642120 [Cerioporus squamosus]